MEIGLYTFVDIDVASSNRNAETNQRYKNLMEEIELADQLGLDVFGIGEHHRPDYAASSPATLLAAAAVRTKQIRLTSAVTVLSSDDPVRVFQQFATVDQLSSGRAEIMVGRGSFIESFPLFGYDLKDYDQLFEDKLELLLEINKSEHVNWNKGKRTIKGLGIYPRPFHSQIPVWIAAGGTPASAVRAGQLGLPLALAIIGGFPRQFVPFVDLYKETLKENGHRGMNLGINSLLYVADDSQKAADEMFGPYSAVMSRIGRERGWPPLSRDQYEASRQTQGALLIGSPQEVIDKILYEHELFGHTRFLGQMSMGTLPHKKLLRSMELFGTVVVPAIKKALGTKKPS